ncbi:TIGR04222 domain-containing membrane protein [Kitasatospora sp. NA04385]|uniref:TIGR04222 domain-containing membrane protein n=1 Tax=Kitasatospora sp. NA04385 TaxID=2742135 RepID=UPI0015919A17|nr:TIGR04222 domain-containing membrane protein [Kitasatospora sp. NA04385]QKW22002.1 TIGR04222 domain-containing membrane protein [Kitasatospora sp. NA04385]
MWNFRFVLAFALVAFTLALAAVRNRRSRRVTDPQGLPGRGQPLLDVAFLAGGPARAVDTALVRMEREGRVAISRAGRVTVTDDRTSDPVERTLITAVGGRAGRDLSVLRASVTGSPEVQRIGDGLAARGLMRHPGALRSARRARLLVVLALLVAIVLGTVSTVQWAGSAGWDTTAPPFIPFIPLVLLTVVVLVASRVPRRRITPAGLRQLQLVRGKGPWRPHEVDRAHAAVVGAFALDGAGSLRKPELRALRAALEGPAAATRSGRSSRGSGADGTPEFAAGAGAGSAAWCGSTPASSCGSSGHHSGGHSGGHSCGSSSHSCGSSSSHSCGSSSHSCGSSSSCGSSCGGGGCGSS